MKKFLIGLAAALAILCSQKVISQTVPGAVNPDITQDNIQTTICISGFTKTIRPSASYTNRIKKQQMVELSLPGLPSDYEEDHLISLELGGHPTDVQNLWPQPWKGAENARKKDRLENRLKKLVCSGEITLKEAQDAISTNWVEAFDKYVTTRRKK